MLVFNFLSVFESTLSFVIDIINCSMKLKLQHVSWELRLIRWQYFVKKSTSVQSKL